jgi:arylsulfatase A-like enzyme
MPKRVVVFGVDGVRSDSLRAAHTPRIDAIEAAGFLGEFELSTAAPTMSGPTWATVATGVGPQLHGVYTNVFANHRLAAFPDFLTRAKRKGLRTYLAASWGPLATTEYGGPIFGPPTWLDYVDCDQLGCEVADEQLTTAAAHRLGTLDIDAAFVYLGDPDHVAHEIGTGAPYLAAIERADRQIGELLDVIAARPDHDPADWTYLVVTDHGHRDGGGHGQRSRWERSAWLAACGPRVPTAAPDGLSHVDLAPTVLAALDLPGYTEDGFAGTSFLSPAPASATVPGNHGW